MSDLEERTARSRQLHALAMRLGAGNGIGEEISPRAFAELLRLVAEDIAKLSDEADFRMADNLSDAVAEAAWQAMKKESSGYEPASMSLVDNNGFTISLEDPRPDGYTWTITGKRERK